MQERIIEFLKKKPGYLSGEDISAHLKVSRQALWKHIQELKDLGYEIEAVPHLGYKLTCVPDKLYDFEVAHGLNTKILGRKILYFDSLGSTMDMAMQLGLSGAAEGTVVIAETQTKGRGRLGRNWSSPKRKGLYFSIILRPAIFPTQAPILTLLAAVGICEAVEELTGLTPQIKWPNDLLLRGKKFGGILTELNAETDKVNFVNLGIGINVNNDQKTLISGATSLKEEMKEGASRVKLIQAVLRSIEEGYFVFQNKGSASIIRKWRDYAVTLGKHIKVYSDKAHLEGLATDIDDSGALLIRKDSGAIQKVFAGDVIHCR